MLVECCPWMGFLPGAHRPAAIQCPARLDDDLTLGTPGRCLEAFVDGLTFEALGLERAPPAATGRPADHPADW